MTSPGMHTKYRSLGSSLRPVRNDHTRVGDLGLGRGHRKAPRHSQLSVMGALEHNADFREAVARLRAGLDRAWEAFAGAWKVSGRRLEALEGPWNAPGGPLEALGALERSGIVCASWGTFCTFLEGPSTPPC